MDNLWQKLNYRIRNRLYWHSLPIFLLAMVAIGAFGWVNYTRDMKTKMLDNQAQELASRIEGVWARAASEAMSLETHKEDLLAVGSGGYRRVPETGCTVWPTSLLESGLVRGLAFLDADGPEAGTPLVVSFAGGDSVVHPFNHRLVSQWLQDQSAWLSGPQGGSAGQGEPGILEVADYRWHRVQVFPPILLQDIAEAPGQAGEASWQALLPVLVREADHHGHDRDLDRALSGSHHPSGVHGVYFFDLQALLDSSPPDAWWCAVDRAGRILAGSDPGLRPGREMAAARSVAASGPLGEIPDGELLGGLPAGAEPSEAWGGRSHQTETWLVSSVQSGLPFRIVAARSADALHSVIFNYTLAGSALGLLALGLVLGGLTREIGAVTRRLTSLGASMKQVARGSLGHRLPADEKDEVGELFRYFNHMAENLEESHRQSQKNAAKLHASLANMQILDKAKQDFLVLISHEVRTPLTAIMGGVDYLKSSLKQLSAQEREALTAISLPEILTIIENNGQRLRGFMNDAILMTNIQSSHRRSRVDKVAVSALLDEALAKLEPKIAERGIEVANELGSAAGWSVLGEGEVLRVALGKILDNAVTHNVDQGMVVIREAREVPGMGTIAELLERCGGPDKLSAEFDQWRDQDIRWRLLEVFNTGRPIPQEKRGALFTKFELVGPIENHQRGTGLSLPIAQTALERHGGGIFVHSQELKGNSFYLLLPTLGGAESLPAGVASGLWDDVPEGLGGRTGDEEVGDPGDAAWCEVELHHGGPGAAGGPGQAGGGPDGPGGAHDEEDLAIGRRTF